MKGKPLDAARKYRLWWNIWIEEEGVKGRRIEVRRGGLLEGVLFLGITSAMSREYAAPTSHEKGQSGQNYDTKHTSFAHNAFNQPLLNSVTLIPGEPHVNVVRRYCRIE